MCYLGLNTGVVSRETKEITYSTMESEAIMVSKVTAAIMRSEVTVATM
jgi:hypothetical protein